MKESPAITELRDGLLGLGVECESENVESHDEYGGGDCYIQSVTWCVDGTTMRAMYAWCVDCDGDREGVTLGWKFGYLEWWPDLRYEQSRIASPDEILEVVYGCQPGVEAPD